MAIEKLPKLPYAVFVKYIDPIIKDKDYEIAIQALESKVSCGNPFLAQYVEQIAEESKDPDRVFRMAYFGYTVLEDQLGDKMPLVSKDSIDSLAVRPINIKDIKRRIENHLQIFHRFMTNIEKDSEDPKAIEKIGCELCYLIGIELTPYSFEAMYSKNGLDFMDSQ